MAEISNSYLTPVFNVKLKRPSISVDVPIPPPIFTETPARGSFFSFSTFPVSLCVWADTMVKDRTVNSSVKIRYISLNLSKELIAVLWVH